MSEWKIDSFRRQRVRNECIISMCRKLRLSEIKYHVHTVELTDHTTSGRRKFVPKSVYSKAFIYCMRNKGGEGQIKEGKQQREGKLELRKSYVSSPSRPA